jgi:hypothetical protein
MYSGSYLLNSTTLYFEERIDTTKFVRGASYVKDAVSGCAVAPFAGTSQYAGADPT